MPKVTLGNTAPIEVSPDADPVELRPEDRTSLEIDNGRDDNNTITVFVVPDSVGIIEALQTVAATYRSHHSDDPPEWVVCEGYNGEALATLIAAEFSTPDEHEVEILDEPPASWVEHAVAAEQSVAEQTEPVEDAPDDA